MKTAMTVEQPIIGERAIVSEKTTNSERPYEAIRNSLAVMIRMYYDYQRERMALDGRLGQKKNKDPKKTWRPVDPGMLQYIVNRREEILAAEEATLSGIPIHKNNRVVGHEGGIVQEVHKHPLWNVFLKNVVGCGEATAAVIITEFDIYKAPTVSNLWSFAGLAPGKDRKVKGQKCPYNQFLRAKLCGILGSSFLKSNSPYRKFYDDMRHRLASANWGMESANPTDKRFPKAGHQHKAAIRYMVKMFLKDLYVAWRTLEGLEVREPYQEQYLNHRH